MHIPADSLTYVQTVTYEEIFGAYDLALEYVQKSFGKLRMKQIASLPRTYLCFLLALVVSLPQRLCSE